MLEIRACSYDSAHRRLLLVAASIFAMTAGAPSSSAQEGQAYVCPMHPGVPQDHPGVCPICGMDLVLTAADGSHTPTGGDVDFACPMHPEMRLDHPGTCPICGMDLVRVAAEPPAVSWEIGESGLVVSEASLRELLSYALESSQTPLRLAAISGIENLETLRDLLTAEDSLLRLAVAYELGGRGDVGSTAALRRAAADLSGDPDGLGRFAALEALVWLDDSEAIGEARRLMSSADAVIRQRMALIAASSIALLPDLRPMAEDSEEYVRDMALWALAYHGDAAAMEVFSERWDGSTYRLHARNDPVETRERLVARLSSVGIDTEDACRPTLRLVDDVSAAEELILLGEPAGRAFLHGLLDHCQAKIDLDPAWLQIVLASLRRGASNDDLHHVTPYLDASSTEARVEAAAFINRVLRDIRYTVGP